MKVLLSSLFLTLLLPTFGQTDSGKVNSASQLKKGFYKSYEELMNNTPSDTRNFTVTKLVKSKTDSTVVAAKFQLQDGEKRLGPIYGFSDEESVYIHYDDIYWQLEQIAKVPFFSYSYKTRSPIIPISPSIFLPSIITGRSRYMVMVINEKGAIKYPDYKLIKKLLSSHPDLFNAFKADWTPYERFDYGNTDEVETDASYAAKMNVIRSYLTQLNERLSK